MDSPCRQQHQAFRFKYKRSLLYKAKTDRDKKKSCELNYQPFEVNYRLSKSDNISCCNSIRVRKERPHSLVSKGKGISERRINIEISRRSFS